jgi:hypothetical protein
MTEREWNIRRSKELRAEALESARATLTPRNSTPPKRKHRKKQG